ncbi:MAG: redoxin family protein [Acidobacteriota bacterium]|nr:redoxin family protein [Acidobacteriota bacterium]MDQ2978892.1 redoxin family protein [Acidobacteriota bacterium]
MHDQARLSRHGRFALAALVALQTGVGPPASGSPSSISRELDSAGLRELLAAQKGRVVLVNFWATWCVPCREEFPDLVRLQRDLAPRGLRVLGISTDFAGQTAAVESFLASTKPNFDNYRKKSGDDQAFIETVDPGWGGELPFSVLYGRDGRKRKVFSGRHPYDQYRSEIAKLLGEGNRETGDARAPRS